MYYDRCLEKQFRLNSSNTSDVCIYLSVRTITSYLMCIGLCLLPEALLQIQLFLQFFIFISSHHGHWEDRYYVNCNPCFALSAVL